MRKIDRLLIFDLKGTIAHFRKFYTSSSSLSYSFPPRTTLTGLIAGMLGRDRDSYYEEFSCDKCWLTLSIRKPFRKVIQTVNYIRTKEQDGFSTAKGVIKNFLERKICKYPTPIELVVPLEFIDELIYRVYFFHENEMLIKELKALLESKKTKYPLYLGQSEFLASAEFIADISSGSVREEKSKKAIGLVSVCNIKHLAGLEFTTCESNEVLQYIEEKMPLEFDSDREVKKTASFIYEKNRKSIKAKLNKPYFKVTYVEKESMKEENIIFME